jgi:hypothetical protein
MMHPDINNRFPLDDFKSLGPGEKCKVLSIKYQLPEPQEDEDHAVFCVLQLQIVPDDEHDGQRQVRHRAGKFAEGDRVIAKWKGLHKFPGVITKCNPDGTYAVKYDDGDVSKGLQAKYIEFLSFTVSYRRTHLPEFVIPLYRYERNKNKPAFRRGDQIRMTFDTENSQGGKAFYTGNRTCAHVWMHDLLYMRISHIAYGASDPNKSIKVTY